MGDCRFGHARWMPLTEDGVVDMVINDLGVFEIAVKRKDCGLRLIDITPEVSLDELRAKTEAAFTVAPGLKVAA